MPQRGDPTSVWPTTLELIRSFARGALIQSAEARVWLG